MTQDNTEDDLDVLDSSEEVKPEDDEQQMDVETDDEEDNDELAEAAGDDDESEIEAEDDPADEAAIVVTVEGEDAAPEENTSVIRKLRKLEREKAARVKELERQLAEINKPANLDPGPMPKLDDFDFDEAKFATALTAWNDKKRDAENRKAEAQRQEAAEREAWQARLNEYDIRKREFGAQDYDEAEAMVRDVLPADRQGMILDAVKDPAKVVYALGKRTDILERLGKIANPVEYIAELARLEGKLTVKAPTRKPKPERKLKGGSQAAISGKQNLERLREEAQRTGDFSKVAAYRRKNRV